MLIRGGTYAAFDEGYAVAGVVRRLRLDGLEPGDQRHRRLISDSGCEFRSQEIQRLASGFHTIQTVQTVFFATPARPAIHSGSVVFQTQGPGDGVTALLDVRVGAVWRSGDGTSDAEVQ